jgi:hypothetical protein
MQRGFARYAKAGRFWRIYYDPASNLLEREVPPLANGLDAESWQNPPDLKILFLHIDGGATDRSFEASDFLAEKRAHDLRFRPYLPLHGFI